VTNRTASALNSSVNARRMLTIHHLRSDHTELVEVSARAGEDQERKVYLKCEVCPPRVFLAEQVEATVAVDRLASALLVPQTEVEGFDGRRGAVWTVEDGRLARRTLDFGRRTLDGRLEVAGGLPDGARLVNAAAPGLREGRRAEIAGEEP
jgi:HlyD family secretion protein